jgi:hypothetical protein
MKRTRVSIISPSLDPLSAEQLHRRDRAGRTSCALYARTPDIAALIWINEQTFVARRALFVLQPR